MGLHFSLSIPSLIRVLWIGWIITSMQNHMYGSSIEVVQCESLSGIFYPIVNLCSTYFHPIFLYVSDGSSGEIRLYLEVSQKPNHIQCERYSVRNRFQSNGEQLLNRLNCLLLLRVLDKSIECLKVVASILKEFSSLKLKVPDLTGFFPFRVGFNRYSVLFTG